MPRAHCVRSSTIQRTTRVKQLEGMFDVPPTKRQDLAWQVDLPLEEKPWQIGLIVGPSGCGKSTIARELFGPHLVSGYDWPADKSLVDGFPASMKIRDITGLLSSVGFSSPPAWLRPFHVLSNGEQFRATVARALAESPELAVIDEFTSVVDRTVARIGSAAIAKAIRARPGNKFIAVSCHDDIVDWLQPDWTFEPAANSFRWRSLQPRPTIKLEVARVHPSAWALFGHHHYLSHSCSPKALTFCGLVERRPALFTAVVNMPHQSHPQYREHRTVCLPDFQGVGLGNAMSELIASVMVSTGRRYGSVTSHPAMIRHRARSPLWKMVRKPSMAAAYGKTSSIGALKKTQSAARLTAGFQYIGPPAPPEIATPLLTIDPHRFVATGVVARAEAELRLRPGRGLAISALMRLTGGSSTRLRQGLDALCVTGRVERLETPTICYRWTGNG